MEIYGKKIKLRAVTKKDNLFLMEMLNDPQTELSTNGWGNPVSIEG